MPYTVFMTMDDLEVAVRANAIFEADGDRTILVSSMDDAVGVLARSDVDIVIVSGALHERPAADVINQSRERSISTLGLLEPTERDPRGYAQKLGLTDWLVKPVEPRVVVSTARRLVERRQLQDRTGIFGESAAIQEILIKIEQIAPVSSTVLIEGESGTGKELVAQAIHELSPRRGKPFIAVNASALTETLLESELFGHEKGSFTGAAERRLGRFELANQGTLFLDEVGELPASTQVKLLRVLENRTFFRVGGVEPIRVDVRVVAATNKALKESVVKGEFRDDLYFRLNVLSIYLPPLRERKGDIPLLVRRFIKQFSEEHGRSFRGITAEAMQLLVNAHWPGNVRQLRNLVESMVVLAPGQEIRASDIPSDIREGGTRLLPMRLPSTSQNVVEGKELEFIFHTLVELKLQIEELRRRIDQQSVQHLEAIEVGHGPTLRDQIIDLTEPAEVTESPPVLYEPGMTMADVERTAIEAALRDSGGNRRKAAERLGIGERTLYRKIKEYNLD
jgi:DNA-binding NtrC family response regulator